MERKNKLYSCIFCRDLRSFTFECNLHQHLQTVHTKEKWHSCNICDNEFSNNTALERHTRVHTGERPYKCDLCQLSFSIKSSLSRHRIIHTGAKPYKCPKCKATFARCDDRKDHMMTHTKGAQPFQCTICSKGFARSQHRIRHEKQHFQDNLLDCVFCRKTFFYKFNLERHMAVHIKVKPFFCSICGQEFPSTAGLKLHGRAHQVLTISFECSQCGKRFLQRDHLRKHVECMREKRKKHKCLLYQKEFYFKSGYNVHMQRHTGERPYKCSVCPRGFITPRTKRLHEMGHSSNPEIFPCDLCTKTFQRHVYLQKHRRMMHGKGAVGS